MQVTLEIRTSDASFAFIFDTAHLHWSGLLYPNTDGSFWQEGTRPSTLHWQDEEK
jgi:hypothetical protein